MTQQGDGGSGEMDEGRSEINRGRQTRCLHHETNAKQIIVETNNL
jgi:hypothetical protein